MSKSNLLNEHISVMDDFQYSINIKYDLYADNKIRNYIPTSSAIDLIEDVVLSTSPNSTDRARIFTGAYGKGKSHLALVLLSILCRNDESLFSNLLSVICQTKPELCDYIKEYHNQNNKLLPVVIDGNFSGIRQALLSGLKSALDSADLDDLMPETYFKAAVQTIAGWKENYPNTYNQFNDIIDCSVSEFESELLNYNNAFYEKFISVYPSLTSGSEFNPISGMNVVDLYTEVSKKLKNYGYNGIFVIYDEFSKYLEGNIKNIAGDEIKALQDFAECCNRSKNNQIHILLISHKSILNYIDNLSKTKIDAWKAVSNRFKSIELNTSVSQTYDLINKVICQDDHWFKEFKSKNTDNFEKLCSKWINSKAFSDVQENETLNLINGCYPLSPISTFILPRVSEMIAQNERTLFTFLSSSGQKNTLPQFLKETEDSKFNLITPDKIFDYFEQLFKQEAYDQPIHKIWKSTIIAIGKLKAKNSLEEKILKTVALIYIVDRFDILSPDTDTIANIFDYGVYDIPQIVTALTNLKDQGIIRVLDNKNYLRIAEHTDIDINSLILNETEKVKKLNSIDSILNQFIGNRVVYPNKYNDDNDVIRYFDFKFITDSEVINESDWESVLNRTTADGLVLGVLPQNSSLKEIKSIIQSIENDRIIFILPKSKEIIDESIYKYSAINNYIKLTQDDVVKEELMYSLIDLEELLDSYVDYYLNPQIAKSSYFYNGKTKKIKRKSDLTILISDICESLFVHYPIINNEMINKNIITSQAVNSRNKVVNALLDNELKPNLGFAGSGQETSFMRSLLKITGVLVEENNSVKLELVNCKNNDDKLNDNLVYVFKVIKDFILSSTDNQPKTFSELYDNLTEPKYGIGLKKGVIPVYIACVLHFYKKYAVIKKGNKELETSSRLLESINEKPEDYSLYVESWNAEKERYIETLANTFEKYLKKSELEFSNFDYVVRAIQRWYLQLPKYSKETRFVYDDNLNKIELSKETIKFINIIKQAEVNSREVLFDNCLKIYNAKSADETLAKKIFESKELLDSAKPNLIHYLKWNIRPVFEKVSSEEESFTSVMKNWYEDLSDNVKNHMFNGVENSLLDCIRDITPDEDLFVENFARIATGLRIDDWADVTINGFFKSMNDFVNTINSYSKKVLENKTTSDSGSYELSFTNSDGTKTTKTFDKASYSSTAKLMYSDVESMIEEYGEAISKNEKRQILIDIIDKYLG